MNAITLRIGLAACAVLMMLSTTARGQAITGTLNGTGSLVFTNGVVTFTNAGPVGVGRFTVDPSSTGFFAFLSGSTATIQPISSSATPPGVAVNIPNFITFAGAPTVSVTLNMVASGIYTAALCGAAPAAGQSCTPPGMPFNFTNLTANSSYVSFGIQGTTVNSVTPGQTTQVRGVFTAQFSDRNYQSILAVLAGGGAVPTTYSATIN